MSDTSLTKEEIHELEEYVNTTKKKPISQKLDFFFNKMIPKKLMVWIIATVLIFLGRLDGSWWGIITCVYLGTNAITKFSPLINNFLGKNGGSEIQ
ncbi:MAG: hypothetical protein A2086_03315 [Spirochaetes bacterium GWD1_27_9]|nr:MAG: hypothetical protein A2Z98_12545 [Spirochaetes bacterium GWB1_27_13]OHD45278.1 MAG: hypothetical protein A2086_03315 [Spirochaetes bacterium GWD1_27_9]